MIERAKEADFDAIAALNLAAYSEFASRLAPGAWEVMAANLQNIAQRAAHSEFYVIRAGTEVVGSVAYCPEQHSDRQVFAPGVASVLLLAVSPQHRGKAYAKALTATCIARAREDGAAALGLFTNELMLPAQHVYRLAGFQLEAELPSRHGVRYFRYVLPLASRSAGG